MVVARVLHAPLISANTEVLKVVLKLKKVICIANQKNIRTESHFRRDLKYRGKIIFCIRKEEKK